MKTGLRIIALLLVAAAIAAADMRTWTFQTSGKTMQAEVVGFAGDTVTLKCPDGKIFSVRIAYLTESNRVALVAERAKQWKTVKVVKIERALSSDNKELRCVVQGQEVNGEILIQRLPASVETVLNNRDQQAAEIADLRSWIESKEKELRQTQAAVNDVSMAILSNLHAPTYFVRETARLSLDDARADLAKLQMALAEYIEQTETTLFVKIRNTSLVYQGLPVWECPDPRKSQP